MVHLAMSTNLALIEGLGFDPFFRGLLSVATGVVVLCGSTYLIVATNTGARTGLLIALTSLFGWFFLMGIVWTIYGIGWRGDPPTWDLVEINVDDTGETDDGLLFSEVAAAADLHPGADGLPGGGLGEASFDRVSVLDRVTDPDGVARANEELEEADLVSAIADQDLAQEAALVASRDLDLGEWRYLEASDPIRGEAQASTDAFLTESGGPFESDAYLAEQFGAFLIDGKPQLKEDPNAWDRVVHTLSETFAHPVYRDELIVIQVRATIEQAALPGQAPPVAAVDPEAPLVSVIMERNRGGPFPALFSGLRFTPAMFTVFSGLIFALLAWNMHIRDEREARIRAAL
jgi:hypothetical protein